MKKLLLVCGLALLLFSCKSKEDKALDAIESRVEKLERMAKTYANTSEEDVDPAVVSEVAEEIADINKLIEEMIDEDNLDQEQAARLIKLSLRLANLDEGN